MSLVAKMKKNSTINETSVLSKSIYFTDFKPIPTPVPAINIALSGTLDGGITPGVTMWAGPSKHFKTAFSLLMAKTFLDSDPEAALLFYDSEFGTPSSYFETFGIDMDRTVHTPITDIEDLKFDLMKQISEFKRGDKVIILIDSIGNLASKKEVDDALDQKSVADMTRARQLKSLFRMVTPHLRMKNLSLVVVNHTYQEMCLEGSTLIKTTRGLVPIKDITVGDSVYTLTGINEVEAVFGPEQLSSAGKKFLEIEFDDGSIVRCTHDHRFYTKDQEWIEALNLKVGQEMY